MRYGIRQNWSQFVFLVAIPLTIFRTFFGEYRFSRTLKS